MEQWGREKQAFEDHVRSKLYWDDRFMRRLSKAVAFANRRGAKKARRVSAKNIIVFRIYAFWERQFWLTVADEETGAVPFPTAAQFHSDISKVVSINRRAFRLLLRQLGVAAWFEAAPRGRPAKKAQNSL
jgi:hypothetical protein